MMIRVIGNAFIARTLKSIALLVAIVVEMEIVKVVILIVIVVQYIWS